MKVSHYVADFIAAHTPGRVYGVCGAGAMHLNDAIAHHPGIRFLPMHHEQAASFAAEADARVCGKPAVVHVTAGPGVTNAMTGVACAWADSIPMIVIAGQCERRTLMRGTGLRQRGVSEVDGVELMTPITKMATCVMEPETIVPVLVEALHQATSGRPGPVYIEIPLDVQNAEIEEPKPFTPWPEPPHSFDLEIQRFIKLLRASERPVIIVGNGVRLSGACADMLALIDDLEMPVVTTWNASDIVPTRNRFCVGRFGLFGSRAGNFAVQNADLVIAFGARLGVPQVGHHPELFAPGAKRIVVDIDMAEAFKDYLHADLAVAADAKEFLVALRAGGITRCQHRWPNWRARCLGWHLAYPVVTPESRAETDGVNAYAFMRALSRHMPEDAIVVTDVGTAFVCSQQALELNGRQRLFHASGIAPMGYGLPAAIGACLAGNGRQVIAICGDGGMMFNIQELATIAHHKLPIAIFVLANGGYRTMQVTQGNHFGRETAASEATGMSVANFGKVAAAFGIMPIDVPDQETLVDWLREPRHIVPTLYEVRMAPGQEITPRVQSHMENGKFVPMPLEDMYPYLPRAEFDLAMENGAGMLEIVGGAV